MTSESLETYSSDTSINIQLMPIELLTHSPSSQDQDQYSLAFHQNFKEIENVSLNKKPKINEFELWKQFINHEFVQIKYKYHHIDILDKYKWKLIIRYIIKTTHDFDTARLVKNDHEQLFNFFQRYYNLRTIDVKNVKVSKEEKENIMKSINYIEFEEFFTTKLELIKIICYTQQMNDYLYVKHVLNDRLRQMVKMEQDMNLLNIIHQEYEIYFQNAQYVNIRIPESKQLKIKFGNPIKLNEFQDYIIYKINTITLLFIIVNNIADVRNMSINRDEDIIMQTTYYSFSISSIGQNSDKVFDQIVFYKKLLQELLKREDLLECIDKYMTLNLTGGQLRELENIKKYVE